MSTPAKPPPAGTFRSTPRRPRSGETVNRPRHLEGAIAPAASRHHNLDPAASKLLYARTITEPFGNDKIAMVPATAGVKPLSKEHGPKSPEEKEEMTKIPYREAVRALV